MAPFERYYFDIFSDIYQNLYFEVLLDEEVFLCSVSFSKLIFPLIFYVSGICFYLDLCLYNIIFHVNEQLFRHLLVNSIVLV